jgi:hypothetical protein
MSLNLDSRRNLNSTRPEDDLRARLFRLYGVFSGLLLLGLFVFASVAQNQWEQSAQTAHQECLSVRRPFARSRPIDAPRLTPSLPPAHPIL